MESDILNSVMLADISNIDMSKPDLLVEVKPDLNNAEQFIKNPWSVSTLEDFLFYCCPECPHKYRSSISFTNHAVKNHPKAKEKFGEVYLEQDFNEDEQDEELKAEVPDMNSDESEAEEQEQQDQKLDPDGDFQCYDCGIIIQTELKVQEHMEQVHKCSDSSNYGLPRPYNCVHCGQAFEKEKTLLHHVCSDLVPNSNDKEKSFGCPQCEYKAKSQLLITKHVRRLHKKERKHNCTICGKSFFEKWNLTDHIVAVHQKKKPYVCDKCGKAFSQKSGLSSHNTFQHPDPNKIMPVKRKREWKTEPTPCERCGKILMSKYSLEKHILHTHENVRPFNCETCGKTFKSNSNLKEHISQVSHATFPKYLTKPPFIELVQEGHDTIRI